MSETERGRPGPDAVHRDATPGEEPNAESIERFVEAARTAGRPSLTGGGVSPTMNVRLPQAMRDRLDEVASAQGRRPAEVARDALEEYLASH